MNRLAQRRAAARAAALVLATASIALAGAPAAAAEVHTGRLEVGVFGGVANPTDYSGYAIGSGALYGARAAYWSHGRVGVEGVISFLSADFDEDFKYHDFKVRSLGVRLLVALRPEERFRIHLEIGGGLQETSVIAGREERDPFLTAGAGVRWEFARGFGVRADAAYVASDRGDRLLSDAINYPELSVGLSWRSRGAPSQPAAP